MAEKKEKKVVVSDKDHPSLIEVGGQIRLRVFEDFNVEKELPKWVRFHAEWERLKHETGISYDMSEEKLREFARKKGYDAPRTEEFVRNGRALVAMYKAVNDDRYDIRGKHEKAVDEAILKNARLIRQEKWTDRLKGLFRRKPVPVSVAMKDLIGHIETTSTEELAAKAAKVDEIVANMRKSGQYKKAESVQAFRTIIAEEAVVAKAGFTSYVSEETMIEFLRKSERGTMVDFLRYFEDEIPQEAVEKKVEADKLMVFDNYVVAYYSNLIEKAARTEKKATEKQEKQERERRRDPILFGVIKNSRKLYYVCDWTTDTDDLTLEKLEKELGVTRGSLVAGAKTSSASSGEIRMSDGADPAIAREVRYQVYQAVEDLARIQGGSRWSANSYGYGDL